MRCVNCGKELDNDNPYCEECNELLSKHKPNLTTVPTVIFIMISISIGIFVVWDIVFMSFSGRVTDICEIDYSKTYRPSENCEILSYREDYNMSYILKIMSDTEHRIVKVNFHEYPILFNKDNYKKLFRSLKVGDYIQKSYLSPYYKVNDDVYVLIGSPIQVFLIVFIFIILIPIVIPKFIKDFVRDNKHLGRIGR